MIEVLLGQKGETSPYVTVLQTGINYETYTREDYSREDLADDFDFEDEGSSDLEDALDYLNYWEQIVFESGARKRAPVEALRKLDAVFIIAPYVLSSSSGVNFYHAVQRLQNAFGTEFFVLSPTRSLSSLARTFASQPFEQHFIAFDTTGDLYSFGLQALLSATRGGKQMRL